MVRTFSSSFRFSLRFFLRRAISARRMARSSAVRCFFTWGSALSQTHDASNDHAGRKRLTHGKLQEVVTQITPLPFGHLAQVGGRGIVIAVQIVLFFLLGGEILTRYRLVRVPATVAAEGSR